MLLLDRWVNKVFVRNGSQIAKNQQEKRQGAFKSEFPTDPFEVQLNLFSRLQNRDDPALIFDVGANIGQTAATYRSLFPDAKIISFEPFPESCAQWENQHATDPNLKLVPKAVGKEPGTATFHTFELSGTNSLFPRPEGDRRYYPKKSLPQNRIDVEVVTLDDFVREEQIDSVDILKFDIQGGELNALKGAQTLLDSAKVSLIYTETHFVPHYEGAPLFYELWEFLVARGYSLFDLCELKRSQINGQLRFGNALFVSEQIRREVLDAFPEEN